MEDRWGQFDNRISDEFEELKKRIRITIYGSYQPIEEKEVLLVLKKQLIEHGYVQTCIVEEYQEEGEDPLGVSKKCLQFSDVNFLIFTRNGKKFGVVRELAFIADSHLMRQKVPFCVVFEMIKDGEGAIPPLSLSDIRNSGIARQEIQSEDDLKKFALSKASGYVRKLKNELENRESV